MRVLLVFATVCWCLGLIKVCLGNSVSCLTFVCIHGRGALVGPNTASGLSCRGPAVPSQTNLSGRAVDGVDCVHIVNGITLAEDASRSSGLLGVPFRRGPWYLRNSSLDDPRMRANYGVNCDHLSSVKESVAPGVDCVEFVGMRGCATGGRGIRGNKPQIPRSLPTTTARGKET